VAIFVGPVVAFIIARRWAISLQRSDEAKLLHGYETGVIMRSPEGEYTERHLPINPQTAYTLTARDRDQVFELTTGEDANGVRARGARKDRLRARISKFWFADSVQKPTREELEAAHHHAEHELELHAGEAHAADGHQFDGRHDVHGEELRKH